MGFVEQIFAAAASAGLLKTALWQPADGSAPQTQSVGFSAADTNLFDGLALGTDTEMSFSASGRGARCGSRSAAGARCQRAPLAHRGHDP